MSTSSADAHLPNALVVGANGLIGSAISRGLSATHRVWAIARDADALRELADSHASRIMPIPLDATDDAQLESAIAQVGGEPGGLRVAVNNLGTTHRPAPLAEIAMDDIDRVLRTSLRAVAVAMRSELGVMGPGGSVVNIASSAGVIAVPGMAGYAAAKWGVVGLTRTAAVDYAAAGVRVNAVAPGPIESGPIMRSGPEIREKVGMRVPMQRMGTAEEVAAAVLWLASDAASFVTGAVLPVDGGEVA